MTVCYCKANGRHKEFVASSVPASSKSDAGTDSIHPVYLRNDVH